MHSNLNEVDIGKLWSVSNLLLQLKTVKNIQELRDYHDFFFIFMLREIGFFYIDFVSQVLRTVPLIILNIPYRQLSSKCLVERRTSHLYF